MNALYYHKLGLPVPQQFIKLLDHFPDFKWPNNSRIYIEAIVVVAISYLSLLLLNWSYISLVVFPSMAICFIVAMCTALNRQSGSKQTDDGNKVCVATSSYQGDGNGIKKTNMLEAVVIVLYWALCLMSHFHPDTFAVSQFLLFLSSILGTLTVMMTQLAQTGAGPGVAPEGLACSAASGRARCDGRTSGRERGALHPAEEFVLMLLWFSVHLDRGNGSFAITADNIKFRRDMLILVSVVAVAFLALAVTMGKPVFSWGAKVLVSCAISGLLIYYVVFMLCQWPGLDGKVTPFLEDTVKLLMFWANTLLITAAALLVSTPVIVVWIGLHGQMVAAPAEFFRSNFA
ncbi:hypothetical protein BAE44_0012587 [Dichanthelium oligosanthes]|uniref:Uncharacterized protein n=1 Tax=Dichanthelium oligosanthes TaxID=888268 RepID=A0A1E5VMP3_9POAL|nr:hypothetical protein BAE44_0012587 [Dichanthelium oligosanthes]